MSGTVKSGCERTGAGGYRWRLWRAADLSDQGFQAAQRRIAILAAPQASVASIATVFEDLQAVNLLPAPDDAPPRIAPRVVAADDCAPRTVSGLAAPRHAPLDDAVYDAVVLPAMFDDGALSDPDHGPILTPQACDWLRRQHAAGATFATLCSGAFALAESGLLDGHAAATHWLFADTFRARFPEVEVLTRRQLVVSGARREFITGGASVHSSDVSLFAIARFFGADVATSFAVLYGKSWSDALDDTPQLDVARGDEEDRVVARAKRFFRDHLAEPGLVAAAASRANLDARTFARRFRRAAGIGPREFIAALRLDRARELLSRSRLPIEEVAARAGYADRSAFAKAFKARAGLTPADYRRRSQPAVGLAKAPEHSSGSSAAL